MTPETMPMDLRYGNRLSIWVLQDPSYQTAAKRVALLTRILKARPCEIEAMEDL